MKRPKALLVEDERSALQALAELVGDEGFDVVTSASLAEARDRLAESMPDVLLVDLFLPDGTGTELLAELPVGHAVQCVVITGHASVDTAVETLRLGAVDYLTKPVDVSRLRTVLGGIRRSWAMQWEIRQLRTDLRQLGRFGSLVGVSEPMQQLYETIEKVAPTDVPILLVGESGTGKDLVAETVHRFSRRRDAPFVPISCGALAPQVVESELFGHERGSFSGADRLHRGVFERASGGTLLLDEIGSTPPDVQVKLLRLLETAELHRVGGEMAIPIDVRVMAATNRDPEEQIADGSLREDLYYRLKVFVIHLPPLRERSGDVELLAESFLKELNQASDTKIALADEARAVLSAYAWPGNVRELKNVIAHAYVMAGDSIGVDELPAELRVEPQRMAGPPSGGPGSVPGESGTIVVEIGSSIDTAERALILATLEANGGNKERSAAILGISLKTLYNRLNRYGTLR